MWLNLMNIATHLGYEQPGEPKPGCWDMSFFIFPAAPYVLARHRSIYGPSETLRRRLWKITFVSYHRTWKHGTVLSMSIKMPSYGIAPAYLLGTGNGKTSTESFFPIAYAWNAAPALA